MNKSRSILAPVICFLVMVFIGADFGQTAQAQTTGKKDSHPVTSKKVVEPKKITDKEQATVSSKTTTITKKKIKTKHASASGHKHNKKTMHSKHIKNTTKHRHTAVASKVHSDTVTIPSFERFTIKPSDLWLAKDSPEAYRQLMVEGQLDDLTLKILESAYSYLGTPYRYGGTTPDGFDCSGFVQHVFSENGIQLGRSSREQAQDGKSIPLSDLKPGDLIFFNMHHRKHYWIDHVGLYVGNGQFIHSTSSRTSEIKVEALESGRYLRKVVETRRILEYTR
jgi:cell wall-associated NlpC family hydrolase